MLFSKIKVTKIERSAFWDTRYITVSSYENYSGQNPQEIGSTLDQRVSNTTELPCGSWNPAKRDFALHVCDVRFAHISRPSILVTLAPPPPLSCLVVSTRQDNSDSIDTEFEARQS